jgi:hypothetical protein
VSGGLITVQPLMRVLAQEGFAELYLFFPNPFEYAISLKKEMPD